MVTVAPIGEDPVFVELRVSDKVKVAAKMAAIADSKPVSDLLEDILVDYLSKSGYLRDPVDLDSCLSPS